MINQFIFIAILTTGVMRADHGNNLLRIHFVDVGQGDAIWIQGPAGTGAPKGLNIVIDGGPDRGTGNRFIKYLECYGLKRGSIIDYAIATHPHDDHYPGLIDILEHYEVPNIIDSGFPKDGPKFKGFTDTAAAEKAAGKRATITKLRSKPDFKLDWGELEARIIHMDSEKLSAMGSGNTRENNASTVIRLKYGAFSFLFMGDAEGKERKDPPETLRFVEKLLLEKLPQTDITSTVLKVGHHGSETGSTRRFIKAVNPSVVVIMSGRKKFGNTFLPDATVLERYRRSRPGVVILRTDEGDENLDTTNDADGDDVLMVSDGEILKVYKAVGPERRKRWQRVKTLRAEG